MDTLREKDMLRFERELWETGVCHVCGVDEAGRGPLAGPVCAAAVILSPRDPIEGVDDSKKLSEKKRLLLAEEIKKRAVAYCIGWASEKEIDEINILNATFLAMKRAIHGLPVRGEYALIDGNRATDFGIPLKTIVKGDAQSASIAAASILAKVSRDALMVKMARQYPQYGFEQHKGYPTGFHVEKLKEYGPCPIHRISFLTKILPRSAFTEGEKAHEQSVAGKEG